MKLDLLSFSLLDHCFLDFLILILPNLNLIHHHIIIRLSLIILLSYKLSSLLIF